MSSCQFSGVIYEKIQLFWDLDQKIFSQTPGVDWYLDRCHPGISTTCGATRTFGHRDCLLRRCLREKGKINCKGSGSAWEIRPWNLLFFFGSKKLHCLKLSPLRHQRLEDEAYYHWRCGCFREFKCHDAFNGWGQFFRVEEVAVWKILSDIC